MRVAQAHGISDLYEILLQVGIPWFEIAQGKHVEIVAAALVLDMSALEFDTASRRSGEILLRGQQLHPRHWSVHSGRKFCPRCLAGDLQKSGDRLPRQWHRAWWDVEALTLCPEHAVRLASRCLECDASLDFRFTHIGRCPRGHDLSKQRSVAVRDISGTRYIAGRLGAIPRVDCSILDAAALGDAIEAMMLLGKVASAIRKPEPTGSPERHEILNSGFEILAGWPDKFDEISTRLLTASEVGLGRWGAAAAYGMLHSGIAELRDGPMAATLKDRLARHAAQNGVSVSRTVFGRLSASAALCSVSDAAGRLGMSYERTKDELERRGLISGRTRRGTPIMVRSALIESIAAEKNEIIGVADAAKRLWIGRGQTRSLISEGLLGDEMPLPAQAVDDLITKVAKNAPPRFDRKICAPLANACRAARCRLELAVTAIIDRRLRVVGFAAERGLQGVYVSVPELREIGKIRKGSVTINDAARLLGVKWETARDLVDRKLLRSTEAGIERGAIDAFAREFVSGSDLASVAGVRPRTLMKQLSDAGIEPVASPPQCRQVFYRRSDFGRRACARSRIAPSVLAAAEAGGKLAGGGRNNSYATTTSKMCASNFIIGTPVPDDLKCDSVRRDTKNAKARLRHSGSRANRFLHRASV